MSTLNRKLCAFLLGKYREEDEIVRPTSRKQKKTRIEDLSIHSIPKLQSIDLPTCRKLSLCV